MHAACLSGCVTAHSLPKYINLAASVTHRRLQVSKLCRCLAPKWQPNARLCAAETRSRDGRRPKTACSCHWLLWNAQTSKGRAANNDKGSPAAEAADEEEELEEKLELGAPATTGVGLELVAAAEVKLPDEKDLLVRA